SMKLLSVCQLAILSLCSVLITVREACGTFVPGRCFCPQTQPGIRGKLSKLTVYPKNPSCDQVTVMYVNNEQVCLNPTAPQGRQLIRCWNRAHKLGRDTQQCLRRRRRKGSQRQQPGQRRASSSDSL
uniref:Chemokine interleukin-8-like domain-containing protein n=1 Tax=Mola mola TaxID=94237 RepID=A0A3Q4B8N0_MOLML